MSEDKRLGVKVRTVRTSCGTTASLATHTISTHKASHSLRLCFILLDELMASLMLRSLTQRSLISHPLAASAVRAYGSSHVSLTVPQPVHQNAPPPKAANPPPQDASFSGPRNRKKPWRGQGNTKRRPSQQAAEKQEKQPGLPTSSWVVIRNIPPMSTLEDILLSVNQVMDAQEEVGIVNLDAAWQSGGQVSLLRRDDSESWIRSARIVLSSHFRPTAWRIEFSNRSMAHAFLEYARLNQFHCAWKPVSVEEWQEGKDPFAPRLEVSESMIRVENVLNNMSVDSIRHLFRRYDMTREGPSVKVLNENTPHKLFIVHFADPSWARAAVRELQGVRVRDKFLRMAQYPKQIA